MAVSSIRHAAAVAVIAVVAMLAAPALFDTYSLTVFVIYGLLALSLGLVWGFGGILCFGQAAFFGLGAYVYAVAAINIGESTGPLLLGIAVPFAFSFALGAMMFYGRLSDVYLGVVTLVVTLILFKFINSTAGPNYAIGAARLGGFNGIPGFQTLNVPFHPTWYIYDRSFYYLCCLVLIVTYALLRWLLASPFGRVAVAIRENEQRVELMGYDVRFRKTVLFSIGGAIAGLAGALFASWAEIVTPGLFSLAQSAEIIIWCIVGGLGTLVDYHSNWRTRANELSKSLKISMFVGEYMQKQYRGHYYAKAQNLSRLLRRTYDEAFARYDLLLMPTTPMKAQPHPSPADPLALHIQRAFEMVGNACPFDASGHPAMSIPCGLSQGLPVGMMLVAKHYCESTIYRAAGAFESLGDWRSF